MRILTCHITWTVSGATIKPKFRNLQVIEPNQHFLLHSGGKEIVFLYRLQRFGLTERDHPKHEFSIVALRKSHVAPGKYTHTAHVSRVHMDPYSHSAPTA